MGLDAGESGPSCTSYLSVCNIRYLLKYKEVGALFKGNCRVEARVGLDSAAIWGKGRWMQRRPDWSKEDVSQSQDIWQRATLLGSLGSSLAVARLLLNSRLRLA